MFCHWLTLQVAVAHVSSVLVIPVDMPEYRYPAVFHVLICCCRCGSWHSVHCARTLLSLFLRCVTTSVPGFGFAVLWQVPHTFASCSVHQVGVAADCTASWQLMHCTLLLPL